MKTAGRGPLGQGSRYVLVGLVTIAPLWVTWLVFDLLLTQLSKLGAPWLQALAGTLRSTSPAFADWLVEGWLTSVLAALTALALLYLLGWFASRVIGRRILDTLEALVQRIPLVAAIYGGTKRFLGMVNERPAGVQRVVLIPFPTADMRAVGFVTRVFEDADTGEKHAAVYVPTAPNPTSGYIEIVPLSKVTSTDWTMDEAMSFVITGGATAPAVVRLGGRPDAEAPPPGDAPQG
ncbi:MAG TPA: DUF502 domain-containing protein [Burkholderiaceae bacterium]|nr:DUF502 domain-containing protein [Burkholderiaceae bacterium]